MKLSTNIRKRDLKAMGHHVSDVHDKFVYATPDRKQKQRQGGAGYYNQQLANNENFNPLNLVPGLPCHPNQKNKEKIVVNNITNNYYGMKNNSHHHGILCQTPPFL